MLHRPNSKTTRALLLLCAMPAVLALAASCNLIVTADTMSCAADEDCVNFDNHVCDTTAGVCVSANQCESNAECADDEVCRFAVPRSCQKIRQGNCQEIYPDNDTFRDDNAMLIGVTVPLTVEASTGISIANGAKLGVDQFNKDGGVEGVRPMVLIICDDAGDAQNAFDNGQTLATIGAQAIIGPAFSGQTVQMAGTEQAPGTVANDVLVVSPSATSPLVTGIQDTSPACLETCAGGECDACPGLVWRTSPSDEFQGAALSQYFPERLEPVVKARGLVEPEPPRAEITVYVLYKPDPYGDLLSEVIRTQLTFNGEAATTQQGVTFFRQGYDDIDPNTVGIQPDPAVIAAAIEAQPDAVFLIGTSEVAEIMRTFEETWPGTDADRPYYIFGDGGLGGAVADAVRGPTKIPDPLAPGTPVIERVRGSIPGPATSPTFDAFAGDYDTDFPSDETGQGPNVFGAAGAYDIVFMIAYSSIAARGEPLTAETLARGFSALSDTEATEIEAGSSKIGQAASILSASDGTINFQGASGDLDFDISTGEAPSPIQIWCVPPSGDSGLNSGAFYDGTSVVGAPEPDPAAFSCPF
ncbi:MAG: ABC transporter substrate-binding protein [Polyangiaceae bacterium]|nr:ABC transporter substrate-binding protein [Polyangiaceae bacterium]